MLRSENRQRQLTQRRKQLNRRNSRRNLRLESLEDRRLLAVDILGTGGNDEFIVRNDPNNIFVVEVELVGGATTSFDPFFDDATINGLAGNDKFIIDQTNGNPLARITANGGLLTLLGGADNDSLEIQGGGTDLAYEATGIGAGDVGVDNGTLSFSGFEPILVTGTFDDVNVSVTDANDHKIKISSPSATETLVSFDGGLESIQFLNPANSLTVEALSGQNEIVDVDLDNNFVADLDIVTGGGQDDINVNSAANANIVLDVDGSDDDVRLGKGDLSQVGQVDIAGSSKVRLVLDNSKAAADATWDIESIGADNSVSIAGSGFVADFGNIESLAINGGTGDDNFNIAGNGTVLNLPALVNLDGGGQTTGDAILIGGANIGRVEHKFADNNSGVIDLNTGSQVINYTGLEPIVDNLNVVDRIFTFAQPSTAIELTASTTTPATHSIIESPVNESVEFSTPDTSLVINLADGAANTLTVTTLAGNFSPTVNFAAINGGDQNDTVNLEVAPANNAPFDWRFSANDGNDILNVSPVGRDLDAFGDDIRFDGGEGNDSLFVFDQNNTTGRTFEITSFSIDAGPAFGTNGQLEYTTVENVRLDAGSANDTLNINSTNAGTDYDLFGWDGDDVFHIPDGATIPSLNLDLFGGNNDDTLNASLSNVGGFASPVDFHGGAQDDRDLVNVNDAAVGRVLDATYTGGVAGSETTLAGLGGLLTVDTNEALIFTGAGDLDVLNVTGTPNGNDDLTVAPSTDAALIFLGGKPWVGPSAGAFTANLPGVAGGGVGSDLLIIGINDLNVDGGGASPNDDQLFVYAPGDDDLVDPATTVDIFGFGAGVIIPGFGTGRAFDDITVTEAGVSITNNVSGALLTVDIVDPTSDFVQANTATPGIIVNAGAEAGTRGNGIADDITVTPSTIIKFAVNGQEPVLAIAALPTLTGLPNYLPLLAENGDRLQILMPGELNIFSDLSSPPQVSVTSSIGGTPVLGAEFSSIENTLLRPNPAKPFVNLIGDNDGGPAQDDVFIVVGTDADQNGADGGFQELKLMINGSNPINIDGVRNLNVLGDGGADTFEVSPYADNTPLGWGIDVTFDEGSTLQPQDLLIYNTAFFGPNVSEQIIIAPSGEQHGQVRVTNASFGTPIVNINYVNNLDIIVNDNDLSLADTDTLTLLGTNADNPSTLGLEDFDINFGAAGTQADPVIIVTNVSSNNPLYRVRAAQNITAVSFDGLSGIDRFDVTAAAGTTVNIAGGNPNGTLAVNDLLNVITSTNTITHTAGDESDEGTFQIAAFSPINFDEVETLQVDGINYIAADAWEGNNTVLTSTFLGSLPEVTLNNLTLHGTIGTAATTGSDSQDFDVYEWVAHQTGLATISIDFTDALGDLRLQVIDGLSNPIALSDGAVDDETLTIPVVAGQSYYVVVNSVPLDPNNYSLEIENFVTPVPKSIDLQPAGDTGSYDTDDITFNALGTVEIQVDLEAYRLAGIPILSAANAALGNTPGVAVRVMVNGTEVGFATPTSPAGQTDDLFRYTFLAGDLPADDVFEIEAAVYIVDGQAANATGRALTGEVLLLELDQTAPALGTIRLAPYSDSGVLGDNRTNKMSPAFIGVGEANAIVRVIAQRLDPVTLLPVDVPAILGVGLVGSDLTNGPVADGDGAWEITAEPMVDAPYDITYEFEDIAGNITPGPVPPLRIVIDALAPQRPTLDLVGPDVFDSFPSNAVGNPLTAPLYSDTGMSTTDNITQGTTPGGAGSIVQVRVSAEQGETVVIKDGEQIIEIFVMPASDFVFVNLTLDEDPHPLSAEVFDLAGNRSAQSEELHTIIDFTAPDVAVSTIVMATSSDSFGPDAGAIGTNVDLNTNDDTPVFSGIAEANSKVRVFANGELVAQTVVNSDQSNGNTTQNPPQTNVLGTWEVELASLTDGNYAITFEVEDLAGNISTSAAATNIVVDTLPPQRPTIDLFNVDDTGASDLDNVTAGDPTAAGRIVDYRISAEQGSWAQVKDGETVIRTLVFTAAFDALDGVVDGFGTITVDFDTLAGLNNIPAEGPHIISIEAFDIAGNRSAQAEELVTTIDTIAPITPAAANLDDDSDSGMFNGDNVTNVVTPTFNGVGEANSLVRLFAINVNGGVIQQIAEGRVGSDESDVTDTNGLGNWSLESIELDEGVYNITATFEDLAGNISGVTTALQVEIDSVQPNTAFLDLREADDSGRHNDDNITNVTTPIFTATTEDPNNGLHILPANLKFRIFDRPEGGTEALIYDSNVTLVGLTALELITTPGLLLSEGHHNLKLEVEDRAGNISEDFLLTVVIDTIAPPISIIGLLDSDSGVASGAATLTDRVTNRTDADFVGRAEADSIVRLYVDGREGLNNDNNAINNAAEFSLTVAQPFDGDDAFPNGQWETTFIRNLNDGTYFDLDGVREILATAEDVAGNIGVPAVLDIFIDTAGPQIAGVRLPIAPAYDLFDPKPSTDGPTPLTNQLSILIQDLPLRSNQDANFLYSALFQSIAQNPGNYTVIGDANGTIGIQSVAYTPAAGADNTIATGEIIITFADFLPDDRFTLTVSDALMDPAGNALDGETNTSGPLEVPTFPTGDGEAGGDFVARFTVDTRPEIATWASGTVWVDTNGNFTHDPTNTDFTNRDITYALGIVTDDIFAGNFAQNANSVADGFDKVAAYGQVAGNFRWLIDTNNDGRVRVADGDIDIIDPAAVNGLPVSGNFDGNVANGDEVGIFTGTQWVFDTNHDFNVDTTLNTNQRGLPIVGDFDGDGLDDLGSWVDDTFYIEFAGGPGGLNGVVDTQFRFGFIGVRERPVAADMNMDGIDDIGLWVPDREGQSPREAGEFYFLVSNNGPVTNRIRTDTNLNLPVIDFHPTPFGNDFVAQFGDEFALPLVGNFDPPVTADSVEVVGLLNTNLRDPYDVNGDGATTTLDLVSLLGNLLANGARDLTSGVTEPLWVDVDQNGHAGLLDVLALITQLRRQTSPVSAEPTFESFDAFFTGLEEEENSVLRIDF